MSNRDEQNSRYPRYSPRDYQSYSSRQYSSREQQPYSSREYSPRDYQSYSSRQYSQREQQPYTSRQYEQSPRGYREDSYRSFVDESPRRREVMQNLTNEQEIEKIEKAILYATDDNYLKQNDYEKLNSFKYGNDNIQLEQNHLINNKDNDPVIDCNGGYQVSLKYELNPEDQYLNENDPEYIKIKNYNKIFNNVAFVNIEQVKKYIDIGRDQTKTQIFVDIANIIRNNSFLSFIYYYFFIVITNGDLSDQDFVNVIYKTQINIRINTIKNSQISNKFTGKRQATIYEILTELFSYLNTTKDKKQYIDLLRDTFTNDTIRDMSYRLIDILSLLLTKFEKTHQFILVYVSTYFDYKLFMKNEKLSNVVEIETSCHYVHGERDYKIDNCFNPPLSKNESDDIVLLNMMKILKDKGYQVGLLSGDDYNWIKTTGSGNKFKNINNCFLNKQQIVYNYTYKQFKIENSDFEQRLIMFNFEILKQDDSFNRFKYNDKIFKRTEIGFSIDPYDIKYINDNYQRNIGNINLFTDNKLHFRFIPIRLYLTKANQGIITTTTTTTTDQASTSTASTSTLKPVFPIAENKSEISFIKPNQKPAVELTNKIKLVKTTPQASLVSPVVTQVSPVKTQVPLVSPIVTQVSPVKTQVPLVSPVVTQVPVASAVPATKLSFSDYKRKKLENQMNTSSVETVPVKTSPTKTSPMKDYLSPTKTSPVSSSPTKTSPMRASPTKTSPMKDYLSPPPTPDINRNYKRDIVVLSDEELGQMEEQQRLEELQKMEIPQTPYIEGVYTPEDYEAMSDQMFSDQPGYGYNLQPAYNSVISFNIPEQISPSKKPASPKGSLTEQMSKVNKKRSVSPSSSPSNIEAKRKKQTATKPKKSPSRSPSPKKYNTTKRRLRVKESPSPPRSPSKK